MNAIGGFVAGSIVAKLLMDKTGWNDAVNGIKGDERSLGSITKAIGAGFVRIGQMAAVAGIAAAGALTLMVKKTADAGDRIAELSEKTGISATILSSYKLAAEKAGSSLEGFAIGARMLSNNMYDAGRGIAVAQAKFDKLAISAVDGSGKLRPLNDVLFDIADRFRAMEDGAEKSAIAMDLFGRSGTEMIPLLNEGSAGLREQADLASRLGIVFTDKTAAAAHEFSHTLADLHGAFEGLRNTVANAIIPVFNAFTKVTIDALVFVRGKLAEFAASGQLREWAISTAQTIIGAFKLMTRAVEGFLMLMPMIKAGIGTSLAWTQDVLAGIAQRLADLSAGGGLSGQYKAKFQEMADSYRATAAAFRAGADEQINAASDIVAGFDILFEALAKISAGFTKIGPVGVKVGEDIKKAWVPIKDVTIDTSAAIDKAAASFSSFEGILALGRPIIQSEADMVAEVNAELERAANMVKGVKAPVDEMKGLYDQVFGDIINGFTSIMDGSKSMGEFFSSIVTTMIADLGKLVIVEMLTAKKSILAAQMESVAHFIASIFKKIPFPINIILAAGAFALVSKLFSKLLKFKEGGMFKEPTIAEVGHGTEYVLPEKKLINIVRDAITMPRFTGAPALAMASAGAGGATFHNTVNLYSSGYSRRDLAEVAEQLPILINKQLRRVGRRL
jgi:hypothetical protein